MDKSQNVRLRQRRRQMSREIQRVAAKPISNSISNSLSETGGCWLQWTGVPMKAEIRRAKRCHPSRAPRLRGLTFVESHVNRLSHGATLDAARGLANTALSHDFAHRFLALAAARRHAEFELQLVERIRPFGNGRADFAIGNRLADTDDHDSDTR